VAVAGIVATGANERFGRTLQQLLLSAERSGDHRRYHWVAYDLGLSADRRAAIAARFDWCELRNFPFDAVPPHYAPETGSFSWKPWILWQMVSETDAPVLWLDSATVIRTDLQGIFDAIAQQGIYLLRGQTAIRDRCDVKVRRALNLPPTLDAMREFIAGVVGIDPAHDLARAVARDWASLAMRRDLVLPDEVSSDRHMNDQAVLNCLVLPRIADGTLRSSGDDADISSGRPVRAISTRNKLPPDFPLWADRFARGYHAVAKAVDQAAIRLDKWHGRTTVLYRWLTEYYRIIIHDGSGPERVLPCAFGHYYADPFLLEENGVPWVFFEDYVYLKRRGRISAMPAAGGRAVPVLDPGCHASFPFLFRVDDTLYMVPETCAAGGIDLYECTRFPDAWALRRRLINGVNAAESAVFFRDGRWWLITSLESPDNGGFLRYLAIYHTDDPLTGEWVAHPVNKAALYMGEPKGTGRCAGYMIESDGRLFRPMQKSSKYYSEGMVFMEITVLTPSEFAEREVPAPAGFSAAAGRPGVHHATRAGTLLAHDQRVRK